MLAVVQIPCPQETGHGIHKTVIEVKMKRQKKTAQPTKPCGFVLYPFDPGVGRILESSQRI